MIVQQIIQKTKSRSGATDVLVAGAILIVTRAGFLRVKTVGDGVYA